MISYSWCEVRVHHLILNSFPMNSILSKTSISLKRCCLDRSHKVIGSQSDFWVGETYCWGERSDNVHGLFTCGTFSFSVSRLSRLTCHSGLRSGSPILGYRLLFELIIPHFPEWFSSLAIVHNPWNAWFKKLPVPCLLIRISNLRISQKIFKIPHKWLSWALVFETDFVDLPCLTYPSSRFSYPWVLLASVRVQVEYQKGTFSRLSPSYSFVGI